MMPLCTSDSREVLCGWALRSDGAPWVAQRVCPIPQWEESFAAASFSSSIAIRPTDFTVTIEPPHTAATPAESYPRYSSDLSPVSSRGKTSSLPL